jgi:general secretion pathway protein H
MRGTSAQRQRGLTLVEVSIALAILTVLMGAVVVTLNAVFGANAKKAAGEIAATVRAMYQEAALSGRTCRMTFELPEDDEGKKVVYRTECADGAVTTGRDRDAAIRDANKAKADADRGVTSRRSDRDFRLSNDPSLQDLFAGERARAEGRGFSEYQPEGTGKINLPDNVKVEVWTRGQREPVKSGTAWLYFHPQGYTDRAMIFITQGDNAWTISVSPLTGKTEVLPERKEVPKS